MHAAKLSDWERVFGVIKRLREARNAPVDTFGPRSIADSSAPRHVFEYHILCALQLSSQTKDQRTHEAISALRAHGLTIENIARTPIERIEELIRPVGFYRKKAVYMKRTSELLIELHGSRVPQDLDALLALPGIGPKMAHLVLQEAFQLVSGVAVDTHVHRIANLLGWVKSTTPIQTQKQLENLLPQSVWYEVNLELVGLGQMIQQRREYGAKLCESLESMRVDGGEEEYKLAVSVLKRLGFKFPPKEEEEAAASPSKRKRSKHFKE